MSAAEPHDATLAALSALIAFPTISADSNLALIDYAERLLCKAGFKAQRMPSADGAKSGLVARIGPEGPGGILLSAHSDVVPVAGQVWTRPPFELTREAGRLYGRGTTDMKGFLAAMLSLASRVEASALKAPLMLCISYDEEVGCIGMKEMLPALGALDWRPDLCIVGEPTDMKVATGHKGKTALRATCRGVAGHSSLAPNYVNALHLAADLVGALRDMQAEYVASNVTDDAYDMPYSTMHAGVMQGGAALNIVADHAVVDFELRHLPADTREAFGARLDARIARIIAEYPEGTASITLEPIFEYPGLEIPVDAPAVRRAMALCGSDRAVKVAFGTEAGYFAQLGLPALVCGPGNMAGQGHQADEYISAEELAACDAMMDRVLHDLGRG
ncbi:acetylornithine deacetylase [Roseovarius nanhaiticus]|uniref:Acetylornithine deacetylase n=1 Tax=Roseovarius nanhaiticus TaxID=573024 RepID=A0A1N7GXA2_9RHOB|nr:acetylornithine deacetylase [Roseovarius nanhaiticus]SEL20960.1 acetylornithine deacetylase [Roseovarius nanhaiticus]SIS17170.1 acetylornithine deacetylase [Roseovarius nanhaiticus]